MSVTRKEFRDVFESRIALLKSRCSRGVHSAWLFQKIIEGSDAMYPLQKILWMKDFLQCKNQSIAADCLSCLCHHGMSLKEVSEILDFRKRDRVFSNRAIDLAERERNPGILVKYIDDENDNYVNRVVLALKKIGEESYLTNLLFSESDITSNGVYKILESIDKRRKATGE